MRVIYVTAHRVSESEGMVVTDSEWTTANSVCEFLEGVCPLNEHQSGRNFVTFSKSVMLYSLLRNKIEEKMTKLIATVVDCV